MVWDGGVLCVACSGSTLRRLRQDERGAALLIFTIFLVPLLAVTAVSIDLSRVLAH